MKYVKHFKSIGDYLRYLERPNNKPMYDQNSSHKRSSDWNGNISYEEAEKLARFGWDEGTQMLKKAKKKINVPRDQMFDRRQYGFMPIVPMALINNPKSMIMRKESKAKKVVNLYIDLSNNCGVDGDEMLKSGALALTYVDMMQQTGDVEINLHVGDCSLSSGEYLTQTIRVKDAGKAYSLRRITFPLVHPAMFRRLMFRFIECNEFITERSWAGGYGRAKELKDTHPEFFVLPSAQTLKHKGYNLSRGDFNEYFKLVNEYNKDVKL